MVFTVKTLLEEIHDISQRLKPYPCQRLAGSDAESSKK